MSEKADTKPIDSSEASQTNKTQLPNTGSAASQAAVAAGLALLGLSAGLVVTKGKKRRLEILIPSLSLKTKEKLLS